eukprot:TRINITY_DN33777_c0_g1_i1.p1 TRINITY_DN33777_c0_g1~~TRINITY_DN33777_c0_g1_i1.p1  ORF type:complete len:717 (-),score=135.84 TRINITY_DN33777_c0_g1_i1:230-2380(-)
MNCRRDAPIYLLALVSLVFAVKRLVQDLCYLIIDKIEGADDVPQKTSNTCALDFCAGHDVPREFDRHFLLYAYGASAVLFLLYLLCERTAIHASLASENVYKAALIFLCFNASIWWELSAEGAKMSGAIEIRQSNFLLVTTFLVIQFADIDRALPTFFSRPSARNVLKEQMNNCPTHSPQHGMWVAKQLNHLVDEIVGVDPDLSGKTVALLIFFGYLLEELGLAFPNHLDRALAIGSDVAETLLLVMIVKWALWVLVTRHRQVRAIGELVASFDMKDGDGLQWMLANVSVANVLDLGGYRAVENLLKYLEHDMLDTVSKAMLIHGLQTSGHLGYWLQSKVRDLFLSCEGIELTRLKTLVDGSGGYQNLHKLIFVDVYDGSLRNEILEHFAAEAVSLRSAKGRGAIGVKVLSDVDDTLLSSGGHFPAGCDHSYPRRCVYPGCLRLFEELDIHNQLTFGRVRGEEPSCNLIFLSARPHVYKDVAESASFRVFNDLVSQRAMHSIPTLLPGKLGSGIWATVMFKCLGVKAWRCVGEDKFDTYKQFKKLYPEFDFVFCGDDGQGDLLAGQHMLEENDGCCRAVVIHQVLTDGRPLVSDDDSSEDDGQSEAGLIFHKTYVGAAVDIHLTDPTLLPKESVAAIARHAIKDFDGARISNEEWYHSYQGEVAEADLRRDLLRADKLLGGQSGLHLRERHVHMDETHRLSDDEAEASACAALLPD